VRTIQLCCNVTSGSGARAPGFRTHPQVDESQLSCLEAARLLKPSLQAAPCRSNLCAVCLHRSAHLVDVWLSQRACGCCPQPHSPQDLRAARIGRARRRGGIGWHQSACLQPRRRWWTDVNAASAGTVCVYENPLAHWRGVQHGGCCITTTGPKPKHEGVASWKYMLKLWADNSGVGCILSSTFHSTGCCIV
jgi:hypothetical protein